MISGFPWGEGFQLRLLALLIKEPERALGIVEPEYFTSPIHTEIARVAKEVMPANKHYSHISKTTLRALVKSALGSKKRDVWPVYRKAISRLYRIKLTDKEILLNQALEYARESKHRTALVLAEKDISAHKYEIAYRRIEEARMFGKDYNLGIQQSAGLRETKLKKFAKRWRMNRRNLVKTKFSKLDSFMGGGLGSGEFAIVMAGGKVGKTTFLANVAAAGMRQNKNVALASGELSALKYRRRIDALITEIPADQLIPRAEEAMKKLRYARKFAKGDIYIKQFPTGRASIGDIEIWLDQLEENEVKIDMLVVDYVFLFLPKLKQKEHRLQVGQTAVELRGIAVERGIPVWTATQSNRNALKKPKLGPKDLAEDISQFWTVDFLVAICQTEWEENRKPEPYARLHIVAARDAGSGGIDRVSINRSTYKIREEDYPDESED